MTALLYYSISSGLSEDELVRIDDEVCKNRKAFCIFARNIPSNVKGKTKRIIIVISFATAVLGFEYASSTNLYSSKARF